MPDAPFIPRAIAQLSDWPALPDGRYQPLDADLTAIAALTTTVFGRSFLTVADAAAGRTLIGAGTSSFDGVFSSLTSKPTTIGGYGITDLNSLGDARWSLIAGSASIVTVGTLAAGAIPTTLLTGTITNAQIAGSIAYSKLSLTGAILNSDLAGSIDGGKISGGTLGATAGTNLTGTAASLTAGNVTTNANLTGHVTSTGNATILGSFTLAQLNTAVSDANVAASGANADITSATLPLISPTGNALELRNSTTQQSLHIYQTYTNSSNYERFTVGLGTGIVGLEYKAAGTGANASLEINNASNGSVYIRTNATRRWNFNSSGDLLASADNTYDIGASGATRPRSIYVGTNGTFGGTLAVTGASTLTGGATIGDAANIAFGTTTGTKLGASTIQKIGIWNATPIVQPTTGIAASTFASNTSLIANDSATWDGYTVGQICKALRNFGILA